MPDLVRCKILWIPFFEGGKVMGFVILSRLIDVYDYDICSV